MCLAIKPDRKFSKGLVPDNVEPSSFWARIYGFSEQGFHISLSCSRWGVWFHYFHLFSDALALDTEAAATH
jgi:hypothetical protein